ncbi:MAG: hypothetical protein ACP5R4_06375 [Armatimonadota bacterium]
MTVFSEDDGRRRRLGLYGVFVAYLALGLLYVWVVPPWRGADELAHFGYVRHIALGRGLPVLGGPGSLDPNGPSYEAHQPPLYYLAAAPVYIAFHRARPEAVNTAIRVFSLILGALSGALVLLLLRVVFPSRPNVWILGIAFYLLLPSQISLFATVNNDVLTQVFFALVLLLCMRQIINGPKPTAAAVLGLATGFAALTKASGLLLVVPGLTAVALGLQKGECSPPNANRPSRKPADAALEPLIYLLSFAAVVGWWLWRNKLLYGDPLGMSAIVSHFSRSPTPDYFLRHVGLSYGQYWLLVASWTFRSSFGAFPGLGNRTLFLPNSVYWIYGLAWLAAGAGALNLALSRHTARDQKAAVLLALLTVILLVAAHVRLNSVFFWAHARYVMASASSTAVIWAGGLSQFFDEEKTKRLALVVTLSLVGANLLSVFGVIAPHFNMQGLLR